MLSTVTTAVELLFGPQSRMEDKSVFFLVVCPQNGTAVLRGLRLFFVPVGFRVKFFAEHFSSAYLARRDPDFWRCSGPWKNADD